MEVKLYGMRAECGQIFFGDIILVTDDIELRVTCVQPLRDMPPGDKMYPPDPRSKFLHSSEPVGQKPPVTVSLRAGIRVCGGSIFCLFRKPLGVGAVHPDYNKIYLAAVFHQEDISFLFFLRSFL